MSLFKPEDFGELVADEFELQVAAKIANAKRDVEIERLRVECELTEFDTECPHCEEIVTVTCRSTRALRAENARLVAEGNELRDKLTATNALVSALREALERIAERTVDGPDAWDVARAALRAEKK